jgi:hypothetical protein
MVAALLCVEAQLQHTNQFPELQFKERRRSGLRISGKNKLSH